MQLQLHGQTFELDPGGALFWPRHAMLVVADLHLEKGNAFARRGTLLPPYDSHATLARLEALVAPLAAGYGGQPGRRLPRPGRPARAVAGPLRPAGRADPSRRWVWVAGNHDPAVPLGLGGAAMAELQVDGLVLRHAPTGAGAEIAGHLHPKARLRTQPAAFRPALLRRRCGPAAAAGLRRLTGGLNVLDPAIHRFSPQVFTPICSGRAACFASRTGCSRASPMRCTIGSSSLGR